MRKRQDTSQGATALRSTISVMLMLVSAVLLSLAASPDTTQVGHNGSERTDNIKVSPVWSSTSSLPAPARHSHTATLLHNGKVLVAGGLGANPGGPGTGSHPLNNGELYDPATGSWTATGSLGSTRYSHTATLLPTGKVLVAGGFNSGVKLNSAELYDPVTGSWTATGSLHIARGSHTATLLANGKVLVAGGLGTSDFPTSAELYDPASGSWTITGSLHTIRYGSTATLLSNGKVLVAGGFNGALTHFSSAELYDPASGAWTVTGSLNTARAGHTAMLLPNGKVLVASGGGNNGAVTTAELYDPASGSWTFTGSLNAARAGSATLLPSGKVLVAAGGSDTSAELYDSASGSWTFTASLSTARELFTATLLPNGKVLVVAGLLPSGNFLSSAELYDPANGNWVTTGSLNTERISHTTTLLPNGKVLVAGGSTGLATSSAELYNPANGSWTFTGSLHTVRQRHTATLLPNGEVLVVGGGEGDSSAERFDPASESWAVTGSLNSGRELHTATLLPNGKVLVVGGGFLSGLHAETLASAELYDPANGNWTFTGSLNIRRSLHTATLLPNGKVLVAGGAQTGGASLSSAELYDPANGSWTVTGSLNTARFFHTATLLPNGKVLVAGPDSSAELYDPASGSWTATASLNTARGFHTATLLPNGRVLLAGGKNNSGELSSAELYDPASGSWTATASLNTARDHHTATLLPNGRVLVVGGKDNMFPALSSAELYDTGLGFMRPDWQPQITSVTSPFIAGSRLILGGSGFQGISQASDGGTQDSSTNYPIVQLRSVNNDQLAYLQVDPTAGWSDTTFTSGPVDNFPPGPALVTVFTNGIPSDSKYIVEVSPPRVVSRKLHGGVPFDINLPLFGNPGIECRAGGVNNDYQVVFTFPNVVTFTSATVTPATGGSASLAGPPTISPDETQVTVDLTNVSNAQRITVTLFGANYGFNPVDVAVPMGILLGDTSSNGIVNAADLAKTKGQVGLLLNGTNFREDVNGNGAINASDVTLVKSKSGTALP